MEDGNEFTNIDGVSTCIVTHGGIVEKFAGDAVMAAFGVPLAHEDDAERAIRAALAIHDKVRELGLDARIGVESGEVVADSSESTFATLADALPHLRETYCGTIAYEIEHIASHRQRVWLRERIESGVPEGDERQTILQKLAALQESHGQPSFAQRYTDFIATVANHLALLTPFIPALKEMLHKALG